MLTTLEYLELESAGRYADLGGLPKLRVALLSDAATQLLVPLLRELFRRGGFAAEIYEAPFAAIELEVFNPSSAFYDFKPDVVALLNSTQALRAAFFQPGTNPDFVDEVEGRIVGVWDGIRSHTAALVIQSTYVMPYERLFGNYDLKHTASWYNAVGEVNRRIVAAARQRNNVLVNDVDGLASWVGCRTWFDERFWDLAKAFCATEHLPVVARNITEIALAARGRTVKCLVVDLDNTLWGGVVGDDGVDGIELSAHGNVVGCHAGLRLLRNRNTLVGRNVSVADIDVEEGRRSFRIALYPPTDGSSFHCASLHSQGPQCHRGISELFGPDSCSFIRDDCVDFNFLGGIGSSSVRLYAVLNSVSL